MKNDLKTFSIPFSSITLSKIPNSNSFFLFYLEYVIIG
jgi:hypothetical protein